MFESDCWLDWDPDPERAARDADPTLEPYASMSKQQILDRMCSARGGREWEFLQEYFLNRCTQEELSVNVEEFIKAHYGVFGFEELCFLEGAVELALRRRIGIKVEVRGSDPGSGQDAFPFTVAERFTPVTNVPVGDKSG